MTEKERFAQVEQKIIEWAREKGILEQSTPELQAIKTLQELGELADAFERGDVEAIKMELGDVWVTLIIRYAMFVDGKFAPRTYAEQFKTTGELRRMSAPAALTSLSHAATSIRIYRDLFHWSNSFTALYDFTLTDALEAAYEKISKRTGKMVNGLWVKEVA